MCATIIVLPKCAALQLCSTKVGWSCGFFSRCVIQFKRTNIERNMCVCYLCVCYVASELLWVGLYVSTQLVLRSPLAGTMYRQTLSSDGGGLSTNILLSKFPIQFNTRIQIYRDPIKKWLHAIWGLEDVLRKFQNFDCKTQKLLMCLLMLKMVLWKPLLIAEWQLTVRQQLDSSNFTNLATNWICLDIASNQFIQSLL